MRDVEFSELAQAVADGSVTVVDVREDHEFAAGRIPGSISMPLSRFDLAGLPTGKRLVFSCAAGIRSQRAVEFCHAAGRASDEHFPDGFKGWAAKGGLVEGP